MRRTAATIRQEFIDFFCQRAGHAFVPSSPVVPHDDPTLLFTNAGMNQFKDVFLGNGTRPYTRAVNSQKCIRAGGKHNDLEDVGRDTYHHTFFEMLGNWSFGDYFKAEAIEWAWELLTKVWNIDPKRLHATYFEGDSRENLAPDHEARDLWLRYLPRDHVHPGNKKDNFWEMGDTGPCGPCSEIHYDGTEAMNGGPLVNKGDPRVIEIWNLVFIQFNRGSDSKLTPLPAKHVDTGMGFERIVRVLQHKQSNYDTDLWSPIFSAIESHTGAHAYRGRLDDPIDIAYRVIADHIRCLTMAITDGARPSNEGRGFVLRRILRRAVRHAHQTLNVKGTLLHSLVPSVVDSLGDAFPELRAKSKDVAVIIKEEEESFLKTLDRGIALFNSFAGDALARRYWAEQHEKPEGQRITLAVGGTYLTNPSVDRELLAMPEWPASLYIENETEFTFHGAQGAAVPSSFRFRDIKPSFVQGLVRETPQISGERAFKLHDTYGFPIDLTRVMAEERGMTVDEAGFDALMDKARETSRRGSSAGGIDSGGSPHDLTLPPDAIARLKNLNVQPTDDIDKYHGRPITTLLRAIWNGTDFDDNIDNPGHPQFRALITERSNFYSESGGQIADTGIIVDVDRDASEFEVYDTRTFGGYVLHIGRLTKGHIATGDQVQLVVEGGRRGAIRGNHTATHLLNHALRSVLGDEINQKGSLVADDRLRFDFSFGHALTQPQIEHVNGLVNDAISRGLPVFAENVALHDAKKIRGVRAVFGERYPDPVRVVSIGVPIADLLKEPLKRDWMEFSVEFCGGTHLATTDEAKRCIIITEQALAAGVRRIIALTGPAALAADEAGKKLLERANNASRVADDLFIAEYDEIARLTEEMTIPAVTRHRLLAQLETLKQRAKGLRKTAESAARGHVVDQAHEIVQQNASGQIIVSLIHGADKDSLLAAMDVVRAKRPDAAAMLLSANMVESKVFIVASVPKDIIGQGLKAGDWVKKAASACGGSGGGKPDMAQAGGKDPTQVDKAMAEARAYAAGVLKA